MKLQIFWFLFIATKNIIKIEKNIREGSKRRLSPYIINQRNRLDANLENQLEKNDIKSLFDFLPSLVKLPHPLPPA